MRPGPELFYPRKRRNPTMSDEKRCTCEEDASNLGSPPCAKCFIGEPTGEWWCQKCQAYVHNSKCAKHGDEASTEMGMRILREVIATRHIEGAGE